MAKINRKDFLKNGLAGAAALGLAASGCAGGETSGNTSANVQSRKKYRWKMVTTWPPGYPILQEGCELFAKMVEEMSEGRMRIEVYGGGELVPPLQVFDAILNESVEMGHGASYYWVGKMPAAPFFSTVPFGMAPAQMNAWITQGGGLELWEELYQPFNVLPIPSGNTSFQMGGWFNKEINSVADLNGLKMRIPGLGGQVMSRAGVASVQVAGGEIYTNLERGVIDATEWIGPFHDYKSGFHKIAKHYYYPGWHEPGTMLETLVNRSKFEALPKDLQAIIRAAAAWQYNYTVAAMERENAVYLNKLIKEEGVDLRRFPDDVMIRLRDLTKEVLDELADSDPKAKKIYEAYKAFRQDIGELAAITEKVFYEVKS